MYETYYLLNTMHLPDCQFQANHMLMKVHINTVCSTDKGDKTLRTWTYRVNSACHR